MAGVLAVAEEVEVKDPPSDCSADRDEMDRRPSIEAICLADLLLVDVEFAQKDDMDIRRRKYVVEGPEERRSNTLPAVDFIARTIVFYFVFLLRTILAMIRFDVW